MSSADPYDVNGNRRGDRESGVPAPPGVTFQDEPGQTSQAMHLQRLRGPYTLREGLAAYEAHLAEDYLTARAR
jgi:hypothetical protein